MKAATAIGIGVAFGSLLMSSMMDGTSPASFINIPALMIIVGGTAGVTLASVGMTSMKRVPSLYKLVIVGRTARHARPARPARDARRQGPPRGPAGTRRAARRDRGPLHPQRPAARRRRHRPGDGARDPRGRGRRHGRPPRGRRAAPFEKAGGFAPTMGIIGTVLGLVHVLENLAAPSTLGPSISAAFIATLMGVGAANVVFLPIANRLKAISGEEIELRMMTVEGILSIQAGDNPRLVSEKLMSYVPPAEREAERRLRTGSVGVRRRRRPEDGPRARRGRRRGARPPGGGEQRALAADLRRHDHAADGAVHGAVLDLLGEHLQGPDAAAVAPRGLLRRTSSRAAKAIAKPGASANTSHAPSSIDVQAIVPVTAHDREQRSQSSTTHGAASAAARSAQRRRAGAPNARRSCSPRSSTSSTPTRTSMASRKKVQTSIEPRGLVIRVLTDDLLFASGQADAELALARAARRDRRSCCNSPADTRSTSRATPTTCRSRASTRATGSSRRRVRAPSSGSSSEHGSAPSRLVAMGYADQQPIASDATAGRTGPQPQGRDRGPTRRYRRKRTLSERRPDPPPCSRTRRSCSPSAADIAVRGYTMTKPKPVPKEKIKGTIYVMPKEFLLNLQRRALREGRRRARSRARPERRRDRRRGRRLGIRRNRRRDAARGTARARNRDQRDHEPERRSTGQRAGAQGDREEDRRRRSASRPT